MSSTFLSPSLWNKEQTKSGRVKLKYLIWPLLNQIYSFYFLKLNYEQLQEECCMLILDFKKQFLECHGNQFCKGKFQEWKLRNPSNCCKVKIISLYQPALKFYYQLHLSELNSCKTCRKEIFYVVAEGFSLPFVWGLRFINVINLQSLFKNTLSLIPPLKISSCWLTKRM